MKVNLQDYELRALIDWHLVQKREAADDEEYVQAEDHRKRALELAQLGVIAKGGVVIP